MRHFHNLEPSGFHRGQYVGYAGGAVWRIRRREGGGWRANRTVDGVADAGAGFLFAPTLASMSAKLEAATTRP